MASNIDVAAKIVGSKRHLKKDYILRRHIMIRCSLKVPRTRGMKGYAETVHL